MASGHDDPDGQAGGRHIAIHGLLPDPELQPVQAFDLQAAELIDGLDGLGLQRIRDQAVDGAPVGVSELRCDLVIGQPCGLELNGPHPPCSSQRLIAVLTMDWRKSSCKAHMRHRMSAALLRQVMCQSNSIYVMLHNCVLRCYAPNMLTSASFYGSLAVTIVVLLLGSFLSRKWTRSGPTRAVRQRRIALALIMLLVILTLWADWPSNLFSLSAFWRDHALVDGTLVALLLLSSGYLALDLTLENARDARDKACREDIRQMTQLDHEQFWVSGHELASKMPRGPGFLPGVQYMRETALASQRTLALSAEVSMSMQSEEGMDLPRVSSMHTRKLVAIFLFLKMPVSCLRWRVAGRILIQTSWLTTHSRERRRSTMRRTTVTLISWRQPAASLRFVRKRKDRPPPDDALTPALVAGSRPSEAFA